MDYESCSNFETAVIYRAVPSNPTARVARAKQSLNFYFDVEHSIIFKRNICLF